MKSLENNPVVAVAIYNTKQSTFDDVAGIQLCGTATILTEADDVVKAYAAYYGRKYPTTNKNESGKAADAYMGNTEWLFVKIVPKDMYYFDTRFFDEERKEVPREVFERRNTPPKTT